MFNNNSGFGFDLGALLGNMAGNGGMGNSWGEGLWAVIILAILFGWGGYGNGGGIFSGRGSNGASTVDSTVQRGFDTQTVVSKLDGISNGICSLGYDQLNQMNNLSTAMMQASNASNIANLQSTNAIQNQLQSCCCGIEKMLADAQYQRGTDTCAITTAIDRAGDRIVANDNANFRALYDQQVQLQMEALRQQNTSLQARLTACDTQNMINAGNQYVINTLNPPIQRSYIVPNPNGCNCNNNWYGNCNTGWNGWYNNGFGFNS